MLLGRPLDDAGEVGGHYQVRLPSYKLDRATFDEGVLRRACLAGAKLLRPVSVTKVELNPGGEQAITFRHADAIETVRARWIVDASGVAALLARKKVGGAKIQIIRRPLPGRGGKG
jgi:flavin-dependent dehydrogenase